MRPYILSETNWKSVKETQFDVAVLPWGATEAHNYHLPYGTDVIEGDFIAAEAGRIAWEKGAKVIVLPTIPFGVNTGQMDIKLDMNMSPSTQMAVLHDVVQVLDRHEIHKLIILNSHGGNDFKNMIRELGLKFPAMFMCSCIWYNALDQKKYFENKDDHGGEMETSLVLYLTPHLVRPLHDAGDGKGRRFRFTAMREGWAWAERKWPEVTQDTGVGDPSKSTREKGEKFFGDLTGKVADFIIEVARAKREDMYT